MLFEFSALDAVKELAEKNRINVQTGKDALSLLMPSHFVHTSRTAFKDKAGYRRIKACWVAQENKLQIIKAPSMAKLVRLVVLQAEKWKKDKSFITRDEEKQILDGSKPSEVI